jgi:hypothetical protein
LLLHFRLVKVVCLDDSSEQEEQQVLSVCTISEHRVCVCLCYAGTFVV